MKGARALVFGLGRFGGGLGAARWLASRGARVTVVDGAPAERLAASVAALEPLVAIGAVRLALGGEHAEEFERADLVVANPAVRPDSPLLARARAAGARVTSEVDLFLERCAARTVAVTGTQGKSSTATFVAQLLAADGRRAVAGGNLGGSLLAQLEEFDADDVVVLELSSYQLEALERPPRLARPASAAGVTNVLVDHLERHGTAAAYAAAKERILELLAADPGAVALLPVDGPAGRWGRDDPRVRRHGAGADTGVRGGRLLAGGHDFGPLAALALPAFQGQNVALALGLALALGAAPGRLARALPALAAPAHRLEDLGRVAGRHVLDNGVSTTPDSTLGALEGLPRATVLIGGASKGLDWTPLARALAARGDRVVTFGADGAALADALATAGVDACAAGDLAEAVERALAETGPGGTLLFSPACASFDAYANFAERAADFRARLAAAGAP